MIKVQEADKENYLIIFFSAVGRGGVGGELWPMGMVGLSPGIRRWVPR